MNKAIRLYVIIVLALIVGFAVAACRDLNNNDSSVPVTEVSLNKTTLALIAGNAEKLTENITPDNATNKNISWKSSDADVATVNNGTVTAVAAGTATITVTTADGGKTATCTVTVQQSESFTITFTADAAPSIAGPVIHLSSDNGSTTATIAVDNPYLYESISWYITGTVIRYENEQSITLDSGNAAYNRPGEHFITVEVIKNGVLYNKTVTFTVAE